MWQRSGFGMNLDSKQTVSDIRIEIASVETELTAARQTYATYLLDYNRLLSEQRQISSLESLEKINLLNKEYKLDKIPKLKQHITILEEQRERLQTKLCIKGCELVSGEVSFDNCIGEDEYGSINSA